jgi:nicotinamidase-related amidase
MPARHPDLLTRGSTGLFVVDVQERFRPHIFRFDELVGAIQFAIRGAVELGIPVAYSEQYPQGLGETVREVTSVLPADAAHFEKLEISSVAAAGWNDLPGAFTGHNHIVLVGIETHVCVAQTALDLLAAGTKVQIPADAVGSRDPWQREVALERLARAGATITTVEAVLFELLGAAGTDEFKAIQNLIKDHEKSHRSAMGVMS